MSSNGRTKPCGGLDRSSSLRISRVGRPLGGQRFVASPLKAEGVRFSPYSGWTWQEACPCAATARLGVRFSVRLCICTQRIAAHTVAGDAKGMERDRGYVGTGRQAALRTQWQECRRGSTPLTHRVLYPDTTTYGEELLSWHPFIFCIDISSTPSLQYPILL